MVSQWSCVNCILCDILDSLGVSPHTDEEIHKANEKITSTKQNDQKLESIVENKEKQVHSLEYCSFQPFSEVINLNIDVYV